MTSDKLKVLILKSLAINLPILRQLGYVFPRLLHIVVERGKIPSAMDNLRIFDYSLKFSRNSDFDFYSFVPGKKNYETLSTLALSAKTDSSGTEGLPVVITESPIIDDENYEKFYIFLDIEKIDVSLQKLVPDTKEIPSITGRVAMVNQSDEAVSVEQQVLNAAACFLEPYILKNEPSFTFDELLETVERMCDDDELVRQTNDLKSSFKRALYSWKDDCTKLRCIDISSHDEHDTTTEALLRTFVFDEKYLYIREALFKEIVKLLREDIPINIIKANLKETGVLVTDNSAIANYVVKITIPIVGGGFIKPRMMRFVLEELDYPGELSFADQCFLREG